ncbi:MAG: sulfatase-like hydrolase/transferase [Leptospiraceae bacterium]|nr:sulfatase-like hydrolase/transferase [Leptospiraceae bacterium]MCP5497470.1 sulfatase-like hydrolase/transferase [Leptospiraceae bacterium]
MKILQTIFTILKNWKLSSNVKLFAVYVFVYLLVFFLYRCLFLYVYSYRLEDVTYSLVVKAFFVGLRFDLSVTFLILTPFLFLSTIHFFNKFRFYRILWVYPPVILLLWVMAHLVGDIFYFENANKHVGYEGVVLLGKDILLLFQSFWEDSPKRFSLFLLFIIIYIPSIFYFLSKAKFSFYNKLPVSIMEFLFIVVVTMIFIRGGFQTSALRPSYSIISDNTFVNNLGINGVFTSFYDIRNQKIPKSKRMKFEEAAFIVREKIEYEGANFVDSRYPILRKTIQTRHGIPPNVVIVLLESWTGKFVNPITDGLVDGKEVTPYFNQLVKQGVFFKNFFSTGGRTTNGLLAVLTGIPDRPGLSSIHSSDSVANFSGLGYILKKHGYRTLFITGSDLSFENVEPHIKKWGFDTTIDQKQIAKSNRYKPGIWGYNDDDVLDILHRKLLRAPKQNPVLAVLLTISTHYPYRVPEDQPKLFDKNTRDYEFLNVYHYSDWSIHNFMEKAKKSEYFDNTVFLFLADHTHHRYLDYYEDRNIPFLVYSPKYFQPQVREEMASQLDVLPTVLGIVGKEAYFSAMGKDLFAKRKKDFCYYAFGGVYGWVEENVFYVQSVDLDIPGVILTTENPHVKTNVCDVNRLLCEFYNKKSGAFLNLSIELMERNKIFPSHKYFE